MVEHKIMTVQEDASEVPWYHFKCEDCGASRDQRLRRKHEGDALRNLHITCAGCQGQAYITNPNTPVLGECEVDWWTDEDGNEVGAHAPADFMQPQGIAFQAGWLRKVLGKVKTILHFLAGEG